MESYETEILSIFDSSVKIIDDSKILSKKIDLSIKMILSQIKKGKKIVIFGNGGSAADAQHMAGEFIGRFLLERQSLPAISLTTDTSIITSIGNDYSFDKIFSRQCESIVKSGDVVIAISTSGNSSNVINGIKTAKKKGAKLIGLTGENGGILKKICDITINVPSNQTPRIQEGHRTIIHVICELVEKKIKK